MEGQEEADSTGNGRARSTRPYRSTLRRERAEQTRARIVSAARRLFAARGFANTTVALIAQHAEVAQPTVYAVFGTKDAIIRELLGHLEDEAGAERWYARITSERDPRRRLDLFAGWHRQLFSTGRDVLGAALTASGGLAPAELQAHGRRHVLEWLDPILTALESADALLPGLTRSDAVDRAWIATGPELYFRATDSCGWSDVAYERWLIGLLRSQLLAPEQPRAVRPSTDHPTTEENP